MATASEPTLTVRTRWLPVVTFALTLVCFHRAIAAEFVNWDDPLNVTANPAFRGFTSEHLTWMLTTFHAGHWMPLTWLSLAVDHALWGLDPAGYHLTNVVLHGLTAVLVLFVFRELVLHARGDVDRSWSFAAAYFGALVFALHPLRAESVAWVTERRDVLSSAFLLSSLLVWLRAARRAPERRIGNGPLTAALALYAASLASKSMGITLPVVLVLVSLWLGRAKKLLALELAPFFVLAAIVGIVALRGQAAGTDELADLAEFGWAQRLAASGYAFGFYPWKTLLPFGLSPLYELDRDLDPAHPTYWVPGLVVLVVTVALLVRARRWPGLATAWCVYLVAAAPLTGLVQTGRQLVADRYSYLACLPFAALAAVGAAHFFARESTRGRAWPSLLLLLAPVLLGLTWTGNQVGIWHDSVTLWSRAVDVDPRSFTARLNLGVGLHRAGEPRDALDAYDAALALRDDAEAHYNRALSLLALEREDEALVDVLATLEREPAHVPALEVLRELDRRANRVDRSIERLEAACAHAPRRAGPRVLLAALLRDLGRLDEAGRRLDEAIAAEPGVAPAHHARGRFLSTRDPEAALRSLERAIELDPFQARYRVDKGRVLRALGREDEARAALERARSFAPGDAAPAELQRP